MSPTPGRSTLITSAPMKARSWVQVGPDCTWVKSRIRTPSNALPIFVSEIPSLRSCDSLSAAITSSSTACPKTFLFLAKHALRVEVADTAALAARSRVDHRVDEGGFGRVHGRVDGPLRCLG